MTDPFVNGPHAARPALLPPVWPPLDPETGQFDLSDDSDPPDGFFTDPDIARRLSEATTIAQGLSPAEAMRDSNSKLSDLTRVQWDLDVRRHAYEEAKAFSFVDPGDGAEPVFAELSPEQAARIGGFSERTGLQVDFPPEHGGFFALVRDPVEDREIGVVPKGLVLALADDAPGSGRIDAEAGIPDPTRDPDDGGGWFSGFLSSGQIREMVLDMIPIVGNIRAGRDAVESYGEAIEAARREDWDAFFAHGGMGLLNTAGALAGPFGGPLIRLIRAGIRRFVDITPGVRNIAAARGLKNAKKAGEASLPGIGVEQAFRKSFNRLTDDQKKLIQGMFPNMLGTTGERHAIRQLTRVGQGVAGPSAKATTRVNIDGKMVTRRFDGIIEDVQHNILVRGFKLFQPKTKRAALEVKVNASSYRRQKPIDEAAVKDGTSVQEVTLLRYPVKAIPPKEFERTIRDMLSKHTSGKSPRLTEKDVNGLVRDMNRLHRSGWDWVTAELVIGITARQAANIIAGKEAQSWREESEKQGSTMAGIMTGA